MFSDSITSRFWSKVDTSGGPDACWPWITRNGTPKEYGSFKANRRKYKAHRVSFFLAYGYWPEPCACHTCDNPPCVNPKHLFECTKAINNADRDEKGRGYRGEQKGERDGYAKLTDEIVHMIRLAHARGEGSQGFIAHKFGTSQSQVQRIISRKTWNHVD